MAYLFGGWGTKYWGEWSVIYEGREHDIQTEFITLAFMPLIPLKSVLVLDETDTSSGITISSNITYTKLDLFWPQILNIWSTVVGFWFGVFIIGRIFEKRRMHRIDAVGLIQDILIHVILMVLPILSMYLAKKYDRNMKLPIESIVAFIILLISLFISMIIH